MSQDLSQADMDQKTEEREIAKTIIAQAGARLIASISKRDLVALDRNEIRRGGLQFSLRAGGSRILWKLVVTYTHADDYRTALHKIDRRTLAGSIVTSSDGIYAEQLADEVARMAEVAGA